MAGGGGGGGFHPRVLAVYATAHFLKECLSDWHLVGLTGQLEADELLQGKKALGAQVPPLLLGVA